MHSELNVPWRFLIGAALTAIASSALAGEITLYQDRDFRGDTLTLGRPASNLERTGFNDTAASAVVREGVWEACTEPLFRGSCRRLAPGEYNRFEGALKDRIASVREIVGVSVAPAPAPVAAAPTITAPPVVEAAGPRIVLYQEPGFSGSGVEITETHGNLDMIPRYGGASAVIVYGGTWRLCTQQYYRGQCADFTPGRYDSLGALNGRVDSAELISAAPVGVVVATPSPEGRVVLYDQPDFTGQALVIQRGAMPDLGAIGFMDRAASMRIDSGYWMFCNDTGFRGSCRTFGPGEYPRLSSDIDHQIASLRRVNPVYGALAVH